MNGEARFAADLEAARLHMEAGELFRAKKMTQSLLEDKPENEEVQKLMAQVLEREITRRKELLQDKAPEEFNEDERQSEARTWLERAEALYTEGHLEEAYLAAEKVFLYEPGNARASALLDDLKTQMMLQGKKEGMVIHEMMRDETLLRVDRYHTQAREALAKGRLGEAKLAVNKILLLEPEDREGLKLFKELERRERAAA